ncbi:MAG TPA: VWA domain-containing protein [Candidatus Binatia bacterium]|nr:VWA domain-containing protein [Candidatus Binatia bacterium]
MKTTHLREFLAGLLFCGLTFEPAWLPAVRAAAQTQGQSQGQSQDQSQKPAPEQGQEQKPPVNVLNPGSGQQQGNKPGDQYTLSVEVPVVNVPVVVADDRGDTITGLKQVNFRVTEDGVPQSITNFAVPEAPITAVLLVEFSSIGIYGYPVFAANAVNWADSFLHQLKQQDWVALMSFDLHTRVEVDFTQDKMAVHQYLSRMIIPGFRESCVYDALLDTLDRMADVKGRKAVLLLASGHDTFSKHTFDQTMKRLKETDVAVFPVSVSQIVQIMRESNSPYSRGSITDAQSNSQMKEFAILTGGQAFFPRFDGEIPGIMQQVAGMLRAQYSLGYTPTNAARDGKYRKIKVEVVDKNGGPLTVQDQKGKKLKLVVFARQGYNAPKGPVS